MKKEKNKVLVIVANRLTSSQAAKCVDAVIRHKGNDASRRGTIFMEDVELPKLKGGRR